ncbi:hypothetical protein DPMN_131205 [Dreissena polymorpha]|uniref:Uncharacterized protein n=1 Tax=Dreissena polymorpha TaxID=45954 RepID=A0A9D4H6J1_DREPO|nr:hypothetical protein DPMN_131205 [Dreissena polymorpha]
MFKTVKAIKGNRLGLGFGLVLGSSGWYGSRMGGTSNGNTLVYHSRVAAAVAVVVTLRLMNGMYNMWSVFTAVVLGVGVGTGDGLVVSSKYQSNLIINKEVFEQTDFNKRHKNLSMKPFHFACILKLSKAQIQEKEFKDGLIDQLYELLLEHFNAHAHSIGFPELVLPAMLQLKDFLKKCKVGNFTKQVRQIVDKVEENSKYIVARRRTVNISLADDKAIDQWERECETAGPPLHKFHATWRKLRDRELMHKIAARDTVVDTELPTIKRQQKASTDEKKEFSALFDDDSEEEQDLTDRFLPPAEKKKLQKAKAAAASKTAKQTGNVDVNDDDEDDYSDFDSDELEQLAGSADDDDDENDDGDDDDGDEGAVDDDSDDDDVKEEAADAGDDGDDDIPEGEDIVKDFSMSSDEED